ncbi:MAG TPA: PLP-dependent aminotransferase family protein, partial [Clostridiales bacterium]|nr:PLP-dependent aminotransferase family protein [Clostridiales bacterium]
KKRSPEPQDEEDCFTGSTTQSGESEEGEEYFPLTVYSKAVRAVLADYGEKLFEKSPPTGHPVLKEAIARYLNRNRGIRAKAANVIIGSGSEYFYGIIVDMLGSDKTYAVEKPCYEKIKKIYELKGVKIEELALGKNGINSKELLSSTATVLHVTPYGSYPTGVTANARKREEYIGWARKRGGVIIEDDFQSEFCLNARLTQTLFASNRKCVIYLNTFSKTIFPSMRAGYMVLPDEYAELYYKKLGFYSCTVPLLEQLVIARILNDGSFERHLNKLRRHKKLLGK